MRFSSILPLFLLAHVPLNAQVFQHCAGFGLVWYSPQRQHFTAEIGPGGERVEVHSAQNFKNYFTLYYEPSVRLTYWTKPNAALRLSAPITFTGLGNFSSSGGQTYTDDRNFALFHVPVLLEFAIGARSWGRDARGEFGAFASAGMSWAYYAKRSIDVKSSSVKPCISFGLRVKGSYFSLQLSATGNFVPAREGKDPDEYVFVESSPQGQIVNARVVRPREPHVLRSLQVGMIFNWPRPKKAAN